MNCSFMSYSQEQQCVNSVIPQIPAKLDILDYLYTDGNEYKLNKNPLVLDINKTCDHQLKIFFDSVTQYDDAEFIPVDIFSLKNKTYILYYSTNDMDSANDVIYLVEFSGLNPTSFYEVSRFAGGEDAYLHIYSDIEGQNITLTKVLLDKSNIPENGKYADPIQIFKDKQYLEKLPVSFQYNKIPLNIIFNESLGSNTLSMDNAYPINYYPDVKNNLIRIFKNIDKSYFVVNTDTQLFFPCQNSECNNESIFIANGEVVSSLDKENPYDRILVEYLTIDGKLTSGLLLKENLQPTSENELYQMPLNERLTISDFILSNSGRLYSLDNEYNLLNELLTSTDKLDISEDATDENQITLKTPEYEVSILSTEIYNEEEGKYQQDIADMFITSKSATIKTARDISIGDPLSKIMAKYQGITFVKINDEIMYSSGPYSLRFQIYNDKVIRIKVRKKYSKST